MTTLPTYVEVEADQLAVVEHALDGVSIDNDRWTAALAEAVEHLLGGARQHERPPWHFARQLVAELLGTAHYVPVATADQMLHYLSLAMNGGAALDVHDEHTLYVMLCTLALVRTCATNGAINGHFTDQEALAIRVVVKAIAAPLATLTPPEART